MTYYPDGKEIQIGDAVLLHQRTYTGVIRHIIESPAEMEAWGLDEPGLMMDTAYGGFVFYPKLSLTDEEVVFASKPVT